MGKYRVGGKGGWECMSTCGSGWKCLNMYSGCVGGGVRCDMGNPWVNFPTPVPAPANTVPIRVRVRFTHKKLWVTRKNHG